MSDVGDVVFEASELEQFLRERERNAFLVRASKVLASSLDYEQTLDEVSRLAVPDLADSCIVWVRGSDDQAAPQAVGAHHRDAHKDAILKRLVTEFPLPPGSAHGSGRIIATGESELIADVPPDAIESIAHGGPEHLLLLRQLEMVSYLCVPMVARGTVIGALAMHIDRGERRFGDDDLAFAEELGRRAALAIDNAQLYREAQRALANTSERLKESQRLARVGSWEWDVRNNRVFWSDQMYEIHGLEPGTPVTFETALSFIDQDARTRIREHAELMIETGIESAYPIYDVVRPDGTRVTCQGHGETEYDDSGDVVRVVGMVQDVTERVRVEQQLRRTNQALLESEQRTRDFFNMASHELRTPLTSIGGFAATLTERWRELDDDDKLHFLEIIDVQSGRLSRLVDDLLTLSKIEQGTIVDSGARCDVRACIEQTVLAFDADIAVDVEPGLVASVDGDHLQQLVTNYLANALTYGAAPVRVRATAEGDWVVVAVADSGPGVDAAFAPRLFEKFAQADGQRGPSPRSSGTGLGLSIVQGLATAYGGYAWYEPDTDGACFRARLPRATD